MTIMILSEENHRHAKAALHAELPHVRSSHLAEAMAAGFGRGSHAALLSFRRGYQDHRAPLARWDGAAFARRIASFGYADVPATAFGTALAAIRLPHAPYVKFRKGDRSANEDHYRTANRLASPMMMITTARTYAQLEWDCITIDGREDHHVRGHEGDRLVRLMFEMFQTRCRGAPGKPLFCGSAFTGTIKKLLPETAVQLAEDYFTLLYAPLAESSVRSALGSDWKSTYRRSSQLDVDQIRPLWRPMTNWVEHCPNGPPAVGDLYPRALHLRLCRGTPT